MRIMRFKKTAALLAATLVAVASPATAAPPWVVTVGAQTTGQVPFSAYTKSAVGFSFRSSPSSVVSWNCGAAAAAGVIYPGSYPTGIRIAQIEGTSWSKCIGPGLMFNIWHPQPAAGVQNKWNLNLTGLAGPPWAGYINNIQALVTSKPVGVCSFNLTGRMDASFNTPQVAGNNNYTQTLNINQPDTSTNLKVSNVSGCLGLIANNNNAGLTASLKIHNSVGLIGIL